MVQLLEGGAYLLNGTEIIPDTRDAQSVLESQLGSVPSKEEARKQTIAYGILESHNTSGNMDKPEIKFDKLTSHDITFVGIIQTARASGLEKFPIPYVLTNCHNSLCAVGGTINEDDHMFGLTCAKKYGGVYVPPHQAVIHQFAREMLAEGGKMILGSDSHTRYGALGTMAMGEGGPELVKQLLNKTYDINMPGVVGVYLTGEPQKGVGPQDVALAIIGAVGIVGIPVFRGKGVGKLLGLWNLYGCTGYLGDVLSYSRLLALGLATGVIASVVNQMGSMGGKSIGGVILFIIVFVIGHVFNMAINLLGAYVHTCRLQYVEFFGKFYEGGGQPFQPFKLKTKYVDIKEEK